MESCSDFRELRGQYFILSAYKTLRYIAKMHNRAKPYTVFSYKHMEQSDVNPETKLREILHSTPPLSQDRSALEGFCDKGRILRSLVNSLSQDVGTVAHLNNCDNETILVSLISYFRSQEKQLEYLKHSFGITLNTFNTSGIGDALEDKHASTAVFSKLYTGTGHPIYLGSKQNSAYNLEDYYTKSGCEFVGDTSYGYDASMHAYMLGFFEGFRFESVQRTKNLMSFVLKTATTIDTWDKNREPYTSDIYPRTALRAAFMMREQHALQHLSLLKYDGWANSVQALQQNLDEFQSTGDDSQQEVLPSFYAGYMSSAARFALRFPRLKKVIFDYATHLNNTYENAYVIFCEVFKNAPHMVHNKELAASSIFDKVHRGSSRYERPQPSYLGQHQQTPLAHILSMIDVARS